MKALVVLFISGIAFSVASPASAFRYEWQTMQIRQAMEKKSANKAIRAQEDGGLPAGAPREVRPSKEPPRAGRPDSFFHP